MHKDIKAQFHGVMRGRGLFSMGCFAVIALFVLFLLFCVIYTVKSAFGLDFFPDVHLKDIMDTILNSKD